MTREQQKGGNAALVDAIARTALTDSEASLKVACRSPEDAHRLLQAVLARIRELKESGDFIPCHALPLPEVARRALISEATLRRWAASGKVRAWKTPTGKWLVDTSKLQLRQEPRRSAYYDMVEELKLVGKDDITPSAGPSAAAE